MTVDDILSRALNRGNASGEDAVIFKLFAHRTNPAIPTIQSAVRESLRVLAHSRIWALEPPILDLPQSENGPYFLVASGECVTGDCLDDAWAVANWVRDMTRKWDISACVLDRASAADIFLIECAELLPSWLDSRPDLHHCAWLFQGKLCIVRPERAPWHLDNALDHVFSSNPPFAGLLIQNQLEHAFSRSDSTCTAVPDPPHFPSTLPHFVRLRLPEPAARVLALHPPLISAAIRAVYARDPISMRHARGMRIFAPANVSFVDCTIEMTRFLYAQLIGIQLASVPPELAQSDDQGAKIALGFEILYHDPIFSNRSWLLSPDGKDKLKPFLDSLLADRRIIKFSERVPDSDEWMNLTSADLEAWIKRHPKPSTDLPSDFDLHSVAEALKRFGEGEAGIDGIAPDCQVHSDNDSDHDTNLSSSSDLNDRPLFDNNKFFDLLHGHIPSDSPPLQHHPDIEGESDFDNTASDADIDVDEDILRNLLASIESQDGGTGPASTLLTQLGLWIPPPKPEMNGS